MPDVQVGLRIPQEELEALARRVSALLDQRHDDGFLNVRGAADYLATTPSAIYHLVERGRVPHCRVGGRLLFDRRALRTWVERGG